MTIDDYMKPKHSVCPQLPKLYRVVTVELDVLRNGIGENGGVIFDIDRLVERKLRRVRHSDGWKWQLVRLHKDQEAWDYFFESDRECLENINYEFGLIS